MTREADTFIIGVAILSPIHVVVGVQTRRVNGKVNVEHDVLAHPIIHQGIQQVKIVRHICQSTVVRILVRCSTMRTDAPYDWHILRHEHILEQSSIQDGFLVIAEFLT